VPWTNNGSSTTTFADGNTGHTFSFGSAPGTGQLDILAINSNTTVSSVTSSGGAAWTLAVTFVNNQGSYLYYRVANGSEPSSVVITTSGNFTTQASWSRWTNGTITADATGLSHVDTGGPFTTTPAVSTGALATTGELSIAFGALGSFSGTTISSPAWSAGYTQLTLDQSGTGATDVSGIVGYNTNAGTAAETPNVSWTGSANYAYMLVATFRSTTPAPPPTVLYQMRTFP
jgi:hypothetical protein